MSRQRICIVHSAGDGMIARRLVVDFQSAGIVARADLFELAPDDSLVQRLETVVGCSVYLVLVSRLALASMWMAEELDAQVVGRMQELGRVIWARLDDAEWAPIPTSDDVIDLRSFVPGMELLHRVV